MENSNSWEWQVQNTIRSVDKLSEYIRLEENEKDGIHRAETEFSCLMSPSTLRRLSPSNENRQSNAMRA